ncbi:hypothetical protein BKA67DRAFT_576970 [Truncatella angustata]|uniref:Uncharacterized protein n=1 Tax=Truncatella angustata TaxID=152316 RepID=A0A9P8UG34_9PEZI|nr:uncharacterized protein BKA67DRAFT_576970 [Truncatella angustata]KAH6649173.1 hypothetical protein BKA67DRAFT_576970 [Truncatella angustata]
MPGKGFDVRADYVEPAIRGTTAVLEATESLKTIKKVISMASVLSLMPLGSLAAPDLSVTDNTGEAIPVSLDEPFPKDLLGHGLKYQASKILAHQVYRDWTQQYKPDFSTIPIHSTFVLGPSLIQEAAEEISGINAMFWTSLTSVQPLFPPACVNVRDVASAIDLVLKTDVQSGTEMILSGPIFTWHDVMDFVKILYPNFDIKLTSPSNQKLFADEKRAEQELAIKWRSMEELINSVMDQ